MTRMKDIVERRKEGNFRFKGSRGGLPITWVKP